MEEFHEDTVRDAYPQFFNGDAVAGATFFAMITCCSRKAFPPRISPSAYHTILAAIGPKFRYTTREDTKAGREGTVMMICWLPIDQDDYGRIYMVPLSELKFYKALMPGGKL